MAKIFDCLTFYNENFLVNSRFQILNDYVDYFVVCESRYDHKGNKKKLNFNLIDKKFSKKIRYIVVNEKFPNNDSGWESERLQREELFLGIKDAQENDYIMYSDSDEIPNPKLLNKFLLKSKYGIFLQKCFVYKLNIFNPYESPWEGTRICKKKNLKSFSHLRKTIKKKNLKKSFWKFNIEKSIDIIEDGGWHFNNLYTPEIISKKLQVSPHQEFSSSDFTNIEVVKKKIYDLEDLYNRGHKYKKVQIDKSYPDLFLRNINSLKDYIL
tara:strand:- start:887 stop:1690 length:804 start_codon:yes stop_codon:yes gene_type:complete